MADNLPEPKSRTESYLAKAAGMETTLPEKPESRLELYLDAIAEGGGGGGTSDFNKLSNRPKYNGAAMTGETNIPEVSSYSDFVGTDGGSAGTHGLVPAPATTDAGKFLKADGTWDTAGGGSVNVVQTTGDSQTDVMSQNATTGMVYADPSTKRKIVVGDGATVSTTGSHYCISIGQDAITKSNGTVAIGHGAHARKTSDIAIGDGAKTSSYNNTGAVISIGSGAGDENTSNTDYSISIGYNCAAKSLGSIVIGHASRAQNAQYSVAIGDGAVATQKGQFDISAGSSGTNGYNNTFYRLITGVYDGQSAHDAATVAQGNTLASSAPTTSTVGVLGQLYTDTTDMHTYQCTAISGNTYTWTQRW